MLGLLRENLLSAAERLIVFSPLLFVHIASSALVTQALLMNL
jgi:hypothetical protein